MSNSMGMRPVALKRIFGLLCAALALVLSSAQAAEGPYVSLQGGASFLSDADNVGGGISIESSFETGFGLAAAVGYGIRNSAIRVEAEVSYRRNDFDKLTITNDGGDGSFNDLSFVADGNISALGVMANVFYDFRLGHRVKPYVGGGIGVARLSIDNAAILGGTVVDDDDTVFAYQVGGGVGFEVTPATTIFLDYRYFATADPSFLFFPDILGVGGIGVAFDSEYASHNVSIGLRYNF